MSWNSMNSTPSTCEDRSSPAFSWLPYITASFVGYVGLCQLLRFRREKNLRASLGYPDRKSLSRMTPEDAQKIVLHLGRWEFPLLYDFSLRLALMKTYAIQNVAKLLWEHSDLAVKKEGPKRYEDTGVLYRCFFAFSPTSDQYYKAVARMNYLHSPYVKSGKILNQDLLYVLYASMVDPVTFMRQFEWREMNDMEVAAQGTLWMHVGRLMGIDYEAEMGKNQWIDGVEFIDDVSAWASRYEDIAMKHCDEAQKLGEVLMDLLLTSHPEFARPVGYTAATVLMGERMRRAFGFPEPGIVAIAAIYSLLVVRRFFVRYLSLPRIVPIKTVSDPDPKTGRMRLYAYVKEPWYIASTFWTRWGPEALISRAFGLVTPGNEEFKPDGFLFEEIGPRNRIGKGGAEMAQDEKYFRSVSTACPFSGNIAA